MVPQRGEEMVVRVTRSDLPQQVDGVTDRLGLRGIQGPAQEVLRGAILTFLPGGESAEALIISPMCGTKKNLLVTVVHLP